MYHGLKHCIVLWTHVSELWKTKYSIHNVFICLISPDAPVDRVDLFYDDAEYCIHRKHVFQNLIAPNHKTAAWKIGILWRTRKIEQIRPKLTHKHHENCIRDIKNERNWFPFLQPRLIKINGRIKKPSLIKATLWCSHLPPVVVCPYPRGSGDNWESGKEDGISLWSTSIPTTSPK